MKLFTFTDIHGNKKLLNSLIKKIKINKPDLILCAGDLTNFGTNLKQLLNKFKPLNTPLLIIPGNHETNQQLTKACKKTKFAINLHHKSYEILNYTFFGYGLGGFERTDKHLESIIQKFKKTIKDKKTILITHQPPYHTKLDYIKIIGYTGNKSINKFIKIIKPIITISGHIHENNNKKDKLYSTILLNPGTKGKVLII